MNGWMDRSAGLSEHPLAVHAFGIDRRVMTKAITTTRRGDAGGGGGGGNANDGHANRGIEVKEEEEEEEKEEKEEEEEKEEDWDWDYIFIGSFQDHDGEKRPEKILERPGRRLAVGKADGPEGQVCCCC